MSEATETPLNPTMPSPEPELPPGWSAHKTPAGNAHNVYYYFKKTKFSTYDLPIVSKTELPQGWSAHKAPQGQNSDVIYRNHETKTSTTIPPVAGEPDLPPGWTAHKAQSGHTYYYHKETKKSTYVRPGPETTATPDAPEQVAPATEATAHGSTQAEVPAHIPSYAAGEFAGGFTQAHFQIPPSAHTASQSHLVDPHNAFQSHQDAMPFQQPRQDNSAFHWGAQHNATPYAHRRREPEDKPKHKYNIMYAPWILIQTKLGRRFVHNTETNESFWKFPEDVMKAVIQYDLKELDKKMRRQRGEPSEDEAEAEEKEKERQKKWAALSGTADDAQSDSDEYTEVEVTDSETEEGPSKRQKTEEQEEQQEEEEQLPQGPYEYNEEDLLAELEGMEEEEEGEDQEDEGEENHELTIEERQELFWDMLEDFKVDPYSSWEILVDKGILVDDSRYTALPNMRNRRKAWNEWAARKREQARAEAAEKRKIDPKVVYLEFLQKHANGKLYWPDFKRKHRKEEIMKSYHLLDRDREKLYRRYVDQIKKSSATQKSEFTGFVKSLPLTILNKNTNMDDLPDKILTDVRYAALKPSTRDPLLETYICTLAPAPVEDGN